jgi:FkbM family methyltransferase
MRYPLRKAIRLSRLVLGQRVTGNPVGVLARLWAWQLWRRAAKRPVVIRCAEGTLMVCPPWSRMAASVAGVGLTEPTDSLFVLDVLRPGDLFVDVGANIGFYSLIAASRGADVQAFEPTAEAADCCERSLAMNDLRATVHRVACGAEPGTVTFTTGRDIGNRITDGPGVDVPIVTLDQQLASSQAVGAVFKVDAEGHDPDVLRGAIGAIERLRPVILVEIWSGGQGPLALLGPQGYKPYVYDPESRSLRETALDRKRGGNMLLIADSRLEGVRSRVRDATRPVLRPPRVRWRGGGVGAVPLGGDS